MAKLLTALLLGAIFVGLIVLSFNAWRRRMREQAVGFGAPAESLNGEAEAIRVLETAKAQYVATTITGEPLNRVTAHGLGFRGRASVSIAQAGLLIERKGERTIAISNEQINGFDFVQAVIDRAVEKDGLLAINWHQDGTALTTVLRFNSAADRNRVLRSSKDLSRKAN